MKPRLSVLSGACVLVAGVAFAEAPVSAGAAKVSGPRRDPNGITGVSPFREVLVRGDARYVARDYEGALAEYRAAIALDPKNPLGHLRVFELEWKRGQLPAAEEALAAAERFGGAEVAVLLRVAFGRALVAEDKGELEAASKHWENFEKLAAGQPSAVAAHVNTAVERRKVIAARLEAVKTGKLVKERVEKAEAAAATPKP